MSVGLCLLAPLQEEGDDKKRMVGKREKGGVGVGVVCVRASARVCVGGLLEGG